MTFVGRDTELQFLNQYYEKAGSAIVVVYGQKGVGKTTLLAAFGEDKSCAYYLARSCSDREQRYQWAGELRAARSDIAEFPEYEEIFRCVMKTDRESKLVLVIDEFHNIVRNDADFFGRLTAYLQAHPAEVLVVLCSSASGWVENSMVDRIGSGVASISGFLKVRDLGLPGIQELFPQYTEDDAVQIYSVLGGVPGLWKCVDGNLSVSENLTRHIINKFSRIYGEMSMFLTEELREPAVYNTILSVMAAGSCKLNDIFRHTGFSRAKISVYLKNLMEIDLVEKVGAGTYRISRPYVRFYFRFLFPNQSLLEELSPDHFFKEIIEDAFPGFVREAYRKS